MPQSLRRHSWLNLLWCWNDSNLWPFTQGGSKIRHQSSLLKRYCQSTGGRACVCVTSHRKEALFWFDFDSSRLKTKKTRWTYIIIGWLFTHTANTHFMYKSAFCIRCKAGWYDYYHISMISHKYRDINVSSQVTEDYQHDNNDKPSKSQKIFNMAP